MPLVDRGLQASSMRTWPPRDAIKKLMTRELKDELEAMERNLVERPS